MNGDCSIAAALWLTTYSSHPHETLEKCTTDTGLPRPAWLSIYAEGREDNMLRCTSAARKRMLLFAMITRFPGRIDDIVPLISKRFSSEFMRAPGAISRQSADPIHDSAADDKQWAAGDTSAKSPFRGHVYAVWDNNAIAFARTTDHGATWTGTSGAAAGVQIAPGATVYPEITVSDDGTVFYVVSTDAESLVAMMVSTDGGASFQPATDPASSAAYITSSGPSQRRCSSLGSGHRRALGARQLGRDLHRRLYGARRELPGVPAALDGHQNQDPGTVHRHRPGRL